jgi:hypothetical protein
MTMSRLDKSLFMNVDLDIYSKSDLRPLVDALGDQIIEMWVGKVRRTYEAHLEVSGSHLAPSAPSRIILRFCKLIGALPPSKRELWSAAKTKSFDIGIESPKRNMHFWSAVSPEAVRAAAEVGAQIAITIYGPMKVPKQSKKKNKAPSK